MNTPAGLEHCLSFIHCQLQPSENATAFPAIDQPRRAVTISRESGCGAHVIAEKLAQLFNHQSPGNEPPWTVFDRNLVEEVIHDHQLPHRLARFMPEDRISGIDDVIDELFGLHPPSSMLVEQTAKTILRLAERGNVIILGRGANVVTAALPHVFHVRIVASLERRCEHMQQFEHISRREARDRIRRDDLGRERYVKKHFGKDINDPLLYHLVLNTDRISLDDAAILIAELVAHPAPVRAS